MRFSRKGSALLVVLGMVAFMVVSAVAFACYMRMSRLPVSYLRRGVSSRMLVKAALARAMDEVDAAVGNMPYPGIWNGTEANNNKNKYKYPLKDGDSLNRNHWLGHVYIGNNGDELSDTDPEVAAQRNMASQAETVSTLCMEALAYLPPSLVNEVRYYSRHSNAAIWKTLGFGSGKHAFTAVDVSDALDINTLYANRPRSSVSADRISLAYVLEDGEEGELTTPSSWDAQMGKYRQDGVLPLVSLADFCVTMKSLGGVFSATYNYLDPENSVSKMYNGDTDARKCAALHFTTDSYFPELKEEKTSWGSDVIDIKLDPADNSDQPFPNISGKDDFNTVLQNTRNAVLDNLQYGINGLGRCALYDYLDENDVPISLAIPTTERVPMICAIDIDGGDGKVTVTGTEQEPEEVSMASDKKSREMKQVVEYKMKLDVNLVALNLGLVYPFRNQDIEARNFEIGGKASVFFTKTKKDNSETGIGLRPNAYNADTILRVTQNDAKGGSAKSTERKDGDVLNAIEILFDKTSVQTSSFSPWSQGMPGAVVSDRKLQAPRGALNNEYTVLTITYKWTQQRADTESEGWEMKEFVPTSETEKPKFDDIDDANQPKFGLAVIDADSKVSTLTFSDESYSLKLNMAVWVWVKDGDGKVVDMVPACLSDDVALNAATLPRPNGYEGMLGQQFPVFRVNLSKKDAISFDKTKIDGNKVMGSAEVATTAIASKRHFVVDPRYNHNPEDWFATTQNIADWWKHCGCESSGVLDGNRDGDIFMQVSNRKYLQSPFELANLPRLTDFNLVGAYKLIDGDLYVQPKGYSEIPSTAANTCHKNVMWRTYDPFGRYKSDGDQLQSLGLKNEGKGFKINPYSSSTNVLMTAMANTPLEWRYALAGDNEKSYYNEDRLSTPTAEQFNEKYAWNENTGNGKPMMSYDTIQALAEDFMDDLRTSSGVAWTNVWDDMDWIDTAKNGDEAARYFVNGIELDDDAQHRIYNCDRKFLYGFWRESFSNKQQLYLLFVRAEATMGGGGGRAVALVWRDPTNTGCMNVSGNDANEDEINKAARPHHMRVLFYRQFD